jgi:TatD DNase family protein
MKLAVFEHVPPDRLLLETDAPDQPLPEALNRYDLPANTDGRMLNHPANIRAVYEGFAAARGLELGTLGEQVERNFRALFGSVLRV